MSESCAECYASLSPTRMTLMQTQAVRAHAWRANMTLPRVRVHQCRNVGSRWGSNRISRLRRAFFARQWVCNIAVPPLHTEKTGWPDSRGKHVPLHPTHLKYETVIEKERVAMVELVEAHLEKAWVDCVKIYSCTATAPDDACSPAITLR